MGFNRLQFAIVYYLPTFLGAIILASIESDDTFAAEIFIGGGMFAAMMVAVAQRLKNLQNPPVYILLHFVPIVNVFFLGYLMAVPAPADGQLNETPAIPLDEMAAEDEMPGFCQSCGKQRDPEYAFCPYCGKEYATKRNAGNASQQGQFRTFRENLNSNQRIWLFVGGGVLGAAACAGVLIVLSFMSMFALPNLRFPASEQQATFWAYSTQDRMEMTQFAQSTRSAFQTRMAEHASILVAKTPTSVLNPAQTNCLRWDMLTDTHVGAQQCVYGRIVKIMHNVNGGVQEYVVRFKETDDYFLVKSEDFFLPDFATGQCVFFQGKIQKSPAYYFMQEVTGSEVEAGRYNGCE